jgi:hypothetical protein
MRPRLGLFLACRGTLVAGLVVLVVPGPVEPLWPGVPFVPDEPGGVFPDEPGAVFPDDPDGVVVPGAPVCAAPATAALKARAS